MDDNLPMSLWDRLLRQDKLILYLLRHPILVPTIPAYAHFYGTHDKNTEPLELLGCAIGMYIKPSQRETFVPHLVAGLYIGTYQEHYRFHNVWVKDTTSVTIRDTVFFKHKYLTNPTITTDDAINKATDNLESSIDNNIPQTDESKKTINQFMELFNI